MSESDSESTVNCDSCFCEERIKSLQRDRDELKYQIQTNSELIKEMKSKLKERSRMEERIDALEQKMNYTIRIVNKNFKEFVPCSEFMLITLTMFAFGMMIGLLIYYPVHTETM
jgi:SMC interacting uncharacterized protein involved in chromosome segregation